MSIVDDILSACRPPTTSAGRSVEIAPGMKVLMLHGSVQWAQAWADAHGWRRMDGWRTIAWVTSAGIRVIGVDNVADLDRHSAWGFIFGPFVSEDLIVAVRLRGHLSEIADASLETAPCKR